MHHRLRPFAPLVLVLSAGTAPIAADPAPDLARLGEEVFSSRCASCHFVPDREIARDRVWLGMIPTTA